MDRASEALAGTDYFEAIKLAEKALRRAHADHDFLTLARVCLPLQEARRQVRQIATDAAHERGVVYVRGSAELPRPLVPGCYLIAPPMIGADARALRRMGDGRRVPIFVQTREPLTRKGTWPVVALDDTAYRAYVAPPIELEYREGVVTRDAFEGAVPVEWFEAAAEAVGDAAIDSIKPGLHPWWRVDDLVQVLRAVPEHEKAHQRLAEACRDAAEVGEPAEDRLLIDSPNPYSF
jgi:hypothetical protein